MERTVVRIGKARESVEQIARIKKSNSRIFDKMDIYKILDSELLSLCQ